MSDDEKQVLSDHDGGEFSGQFSQLLTGLWAAVNGDSDQTGNLQSGFILPCFPGISFTEKDLDGLPSPANPKGNYAALQNFSQTLGYVPNLANDKYQNSGSYLYNVYDTLVNGANAQPLHITKEYQEELDKNFDLLYDPKTYEMTPLFKRYGILKTKVAEAESKYNQERNKFDLSTQKGREQWSVQEPIYQNEVTQAKYALAPLKNRVEAALDFLGASNRNAVAYAIKKAGDIFSAGKQPGNGVDKNDWYPVFAEPSDWYKPDSTGWITYTSSEQHQLQQAAQSQTSVQGTRSTWGWWIFGSGSDYHSVTRSETQKDTSSNIQISFDYKRVTLIRPWFAPNWLNCNNWWINAFDEGQISSGTLRDNYNAQKNGQKCDLPAYTTSFIVAKKVTISASWDQTTKDWISQQQKDNNYFGIGPFTFSSTSSESNSQSSNYSWNAKGDTLTIPDPQIIAFLAAAPPYSPPMNVPTNSDETKEYEQAGPALVNNAKLNRKLYNMPPHERRRYIAHSDVFGSLTVKLKGLSGKSIISHGLLRDSDSSQQTYFDYLGPPYPTYPDMKKATAVSFTSSQSGKTTKYSKWEYFFPPGSLLGARMLLIE